jgi:hypothetical protein
LAGPPKTASASVRAGTEKGETMKKGKQQKGEDLVITTIRAPRPFWAKVRTKAFEEGIGTGELILKVLAEYLKKGESR